MPQVELEGRLAVLILNLKAAKLAGELSEGMILAAETSGPDNSTLVRVLDPPGAHACVNEVSICS